MSEPIRRKRVVDDVAARLRKAVLSGKYKTGALLPAERILATELGVSRLTLRQAMAQLTAEGLLTVRHGEGTRAVDLRQGSLEVLQSLFVAVQGTPRASQVLADLLELRRWASAEVTALAAARRTPAQLVQLEKQIALLKLDAGSVPRSVLSEHERRISELLVEAAGNVAFAMLFHSVQRFLQTFPGLRAGLPEEPGPLVAAYEGLLGLIRQGDVDATRAAVRAVLEPVDEALLRSFARRKHRLPRP